MEAFNFANSGPTRPTRGEGKTTGRCIVSGEHNKEADAWAEKGSQRWEGGVGKMREESCVPLMSMEYVVSRMVVVVGYVR